MKHAAVLLALLFFAGAGAAAAEEAKDPAAPAREVVETFHATLLDCMRRSAELGFRGRYVRLLVALDEAFDLPFMARTALGPTWNALTPEQRVEFVALSQRLSATRYADNFDSFAGQQFATRGDKPAARGTILVLTELVQPEDRDVTFDYRLRKVEGRWRVIDVHLDGMISELTLRRSQYRSLAERHGYAHLVEVIEEKIAELSSD